MMAVAHTLCQIKNNSRHLFLFDTFEGMTEPSEKDISFQGISASSMLKSSKKEDSYSVWCYAPLEEVKQAINSIGYDPEKIHLIKGRVEDTIPKQAPLSISLLRLDTDWYESTRHELIHLFPRLSPGGVIIIDDYGYWKGARQAVDEYMKENKIKILLNRTDITGRIGVVWR
jgi:predicted O-methyltransferase YrrM